MTATPAPRLSVTVTGDGANLVPLDQDNLAVRAAVALGQHAAVEPLVRLDLVKSIPVAGGLAGGSADAAATLLACDALWGTDLPHADLLALAAALGSDVPFALTGGTALGTGRGERLAPVASTGHWHWVLAIAVGAGLSTPAVYAEHDRRRPASGTSDAAGAGRRPAGDSAGDLDPLLGALRAGDAAALGAALANDLQPAALGLRPELQATLDAGASAGALGGVVSGSGPTCAFLAAGADAAAALQTDLQRGGVGRVVVTAYGPASGAHLVDSARRAAQR